jgi:HEAT repeat protein
MDATTKKIVKLLEDERVERRCAAAMILGELRVKDAEAVDALGRCLADGNQLLQGYVLEALAGVRSAKVAKHVMPLLDHPDAEIRAQAGALLADQGARAQASLAKELLTAPLTRRRAIVNILRRSHDKETFDRMVALLPDPDIGEYVLNALRGEMDHMQTKAGDTLQTVVAGKLKDREWKSDTTGIARALRLLGYTREPKLVKTLLRYAGEKQPVPVRLAAVAALRRPLAAARSTGEAVHTLLGYADDADPTLARAVIDTLKGLKMPADATAQLMKLSEGRHAEARKFAVEALGRSGSQKVTKSMLAHLRGSDPAAREAAIKSLTHMEGVAKPLVKELQTSCEDPELVRVIARLIKRHTGELKPADRKAIADLTVECLEEDNRSSGPLLDLLSAVEPESYAQVLLDRAAAHRRGKRHEQAFSLLRRLDEAGLLDDDGRYAAAVSGLCSLPSKKELGRASRTTHPVLKQMVELVGNGFPLSSKLRRDKSVTPDDLFFVGFNFAESKDDEEKEFGGTLLHHLVKKSPRSKLGRSAKNKLKLVGLE